MRSLAALACLTAFACARPPVEPAESVAATPDAASGSLQPTRAGAAGGAGAAGAGGAGGAHGGETVVCIQAAARTTLAGTCEPKSAECGLLGDTDCGQCPVGRMCFHNRCFTPQGASPQGVVGDLARALYNGEEGQRFTILDDGILEFGEAAVWTNGLDLQANLYVMCVGTRVLARSILLHADDIPPFDNGIRSDGTPVVFVIDPPLAVVRGETIDMMFRVPNGAYPERSGVSGIVTHDVDPSSHFISTDYGGISPDVDWDYMVVLYRH